VSYMRPGLPFGRPGLFITTDGHGWKEDEHRWVKNKGAINLFCLCLSPPRLRFIVLRKDILMKGLASFVLWLVFAATQSVAQNGEVLSGQVVDQGTRRPVSEARVGLSGVTEGVTTGNDGGFSFTGLAPGTYTLRVQRVGYAATSAEVVLRAGEQRTLTVELHEVAYLLDPVTSTATRMQSHASEVSTSVSIVPGTVLDERMIQDIGGAVQDVPGVFVRSYGALGDVQTPSIRGSSAGQVLVLLDGQRVNSAQSGEVDLSTLPTEGIDRIEIVRGGASALYGADAVGGVINVITKNRGRSEGMTGNARILSGSFGTREAEVGGDYTSGSTFSAISYRVLKSNGDFPYHPLPDSTANRANADFSNHAFFGKERWNMDEHRALSFTGQYFSSRAGDPGTITFPNAQARKENRNGLMNLAYDEDLAGIVRTIHVQAYYNNLLFNYKDPLAYIPILNYSHNISAGGEAQAGMHVGDWNALTAGYGYRWDHFSGNSLQGEYRRSLNSAYIVDEIAVQPSFLTDLHRIAVVPAMRWDRFSDFGDQFSPKIGVVLNAGQEWLLSVKANYGRSFRAPTFNDLYWPRDAYTAGNPDLKPERAIDFDAGATLDVPVLAGVGASFTWFENTVTDLILWQSGADWVWTPANIGKARIRGIEAGASISPWKDLLTVSWNYTHLDARNKSGAPDEYDKLLPDRPGDMHKLTLQTRHAGLFAAVDFLAVGLRYTTTTNDASLPSYHVFNALVGYAWEMPYGRVELKGEVLNLGDVGYQVMAGYPVPGREFRMSLSWGAPAARDK
jgi:outer membrane cobalamin receptor